MAGSGRNGNDAAAAGDDLIGSKRTPIDNAAIFLQRVGLVVAGGDGHDIRDAAWDRALPKIVSAPCDHCAIGFQSDGVILPGSDRNHSGQSVRHCGFAVLIAIPCHHGSIGFQGKRVIPARRDGGHAGESRWDGQGVFQGGRHAGSVVLHADGVHGAISLQNDTQSSATYHRDSGGDSRRWLLQHQGRQGRITGVRREEALDV